MKRFYLLLLLFTAISLSTSAQIGYQISLLNNATGEPRANERVTVTVKITDSEGKTVCEETKHETSNDFGVVSMSVGDTETFANADWSKLPFFIEASVDGRLIGKSQLLSVPIAEYAKRTGLLTTDILCSKSWESYYNGNPETTYKFSKEGTVQIKDWQYYPDYYKEYEGIYEIEGNIVLIKINDTAISSRVCIYMPSQNAIIGISSSFYQ